MIKKFNEFMFKGSDEGFTDKGAIIGAILIVIIYVAVTSIEGPPY